MKFKIWDKENQKFWPEVFTPMDLATSRMFPSNAEIFYEIMEEREAKKKADTGGGCSICGNSPAVNVHGTYWLCGECVNEIFIGEGLEYG